MELAFRQIHLDFHTSPHIPDVGKDWDPEDFVQTLKEAYVNSVTCFAKCHHGMSYYNTKVGLRHPSLAFDLLGEQIEACHQANIRCPIYYSVVWDNYMGDLHPEWRQIKRNGQPVGPEPFEPGWLWLCLNSAYVDYVVAQTEELLAHYEVDGFFYDIVFQNPPGCYCVNCLRSMREMGLDPQKEGDQRKHSAYIVERFMNRLTTLIREKRPTATIFYNGRVGYSFPWEAQYFTHVEIEALPTGGWGYGYYPFWVRYVRNFGLPTLGMTGRFHRSWADFGGLKNIAQLDYECSSMLANASQCSIGDQLHPRGRLDKAVYQVIGKVYAKVQTKEPWCQGAVPVTEVGLLVIEEKTDSDDGASKMLLEMQIQYDVIPPEANFSKYRLILIADKGAPHPELIKKLKEFLQKGGALLLSYQALLDPQKREFALTEEMGVNYMGPSLFSPNFFKPKEKICRGLHHFEYVSYDGGVEVNPQPGTEVLAEVYYPYFNRTWEHFTSHQYAPVKEKSPYPAVTQKGKVLYLYAPLFKTYHHQGFTAYRRLVENCMDLLIPDRLIKTTAPSTTEVTVTRQKDRYIVHLVNYHPQRRANHVEVIEEVIPLYNVQIRLRLPGVPQRVYLAPEEEQLSFTYEKGVVTCTIPEIREHAMVIFE